MHYAIGQLVVVNESAPDGPGPKSITALPRKRKVNSPFVVGVVYTLAHIRKVQDGLEYSFATNQGEYIGLQFPDSASADQCIAEALGETLPDYNAFYNSSRG